MLLEEQPIVYLKFLLFFVHLCLFFLYVCFFYFFIFLTNSLLVIYHQQYGINQYKLLEEYVWNKIDSIH